MIKLEDLQTCEKRILRKRCPEFRIDQRHRRMDIPLECSIPGIKMTMFLRQLLDLPEDFTVGLRIDTPNPFADFTIVLVRYQGPHGGQSPQNDISNLHNRYHIHFYSQQDLDRRRKNPLISEKMLAMFSSFDEAIIQMMTSWNILDPNGIFDDVRERLNQISMNLDSLS